MASQLLQRWQAGLIGVGTLFLGLGLEMPIAIAQSTALSLATGFSPNPTVVRGSAGGNRRAEDISGVRNTPTGPCVGYVGQTPNQQITLTNRFSNLEIRVESDQDTTLVIVGPGGVWCNDDSRGKNPVIAGEWLPGDYRIWVGSYRLGQLPPYRMFIEDRS
jgi:hypothetical protein